MLAGAVFFFQLANQDDIGPPVPIGRAVAVGDMTVTVERAVEADGALDVTVLIGGVADPDGATGFRLIASGRPVGLEDSSVAGRCSVTEVAEQACLLRFDVSGADGTSRVLFYDRGDAGVRWVLG